MTERIDPAGCACGGKSVVRTFGAGKKMYVCCVRRQCDIETYHFETREQAVRAWNAMTHRIKRDGYVGVKYDGSKDYVADS